MGAILCTRGVLGLVVKERGARKHARVLSPALVGLFCYVGWGGGVLGGGGWFWGGVFWGWFFIGGGGGG